MSGGWKNKKCADLTPEEWEKKRRYERSRWRRWSPEKRRSHGERYSGWYEKNHDKAVEQSYNRSLKQRYGLTRVEYDAMVADQEGKCLLCEFVPPQKKHRPLFVDHNHLTGSVRGLLCRRCNSGVGYLEDPEWVEKAQKYLSSAHR